MILFGINEAQYYCSTFSGSLGDSEKSLDEFLQKHLAGLRTFSEGQPIFNEYRDCVLRNVERTLFFSASHYRRSLDLMMSSSSPWAHVTLYYGSWQAAHALLALFGGSIINNNVIDVGRGQPGNQILRVRLIGKNPWQENTTYRGSHQIFWDLFYGAFQPIKATFPASFQLALSPVSGNRVWQIQKRNEINYDSLSSIQLAQEFDRLFVCNTFPNCLPGDMIIQYKLFELLLEMSFYYAKLFGVSTDALNNFKTPLPLRRKITKIIYAEKPKGLVKKTIKSKIT